jgi:hypothetical protein
MAETKKSIVEEAMADYQLIQEALEANTKEILRSVAREEIDGVVKESINEDMYEETEVEDDETEVDDLDSTEDDLESGTELGTSVEDELPTDDLDSEVGGLDLDATDSEDYNAESGEDYEFDLTGASDEDVISVYKKLANNDEIEVVSPNEVTIKDPVSGSEYNVKFGKDSAPTIDPVLPVPTATPDLDDELSTDDLELDSEVETPMGDETEVEDLEDDDELGESVVFEIAMNDSEDEIVEDIVRGKGHDKELQNTTMEKGDIEGTKAPVDAELGKEVTSAFPNKTPHAKAEGPMVMGENDEEECDDTLEESIPVGNAEARRVPGKATPIKGPGAKSLDEANQRYFDLLAETKEKDALIEDFKKALNKFRHMLGETAVFNQNLTYVTKLFVENSTTATEKQTILERFDNEAKTISESKSLYKSIVKELGSKTPIKETIENKLNKEASSGTTSRLNESTAYVSPELSRFKQIMYNMENRSNN